MRLTGWNRDDRNGLVSAGLVLSLTIAGAAPANYTCSSSVFTTRCACASEAGCTEMTATAVCGASDVLCSIDGARCTCSLSELPLREVQPATPAAGQ